MEEVKKAEGAPGGMAKGSLILGICAIIPFAGWAIGLAAIILGIIELVKISKGESPESGKKFAITGIILGVVLPWIFSMIIIGSLAACAATAGLMSY